MLAMLEVEDGYGTVTEGDRVEIGRAGVANVIMCDVWKARKSMMLLSHFESQGRMVAYCYRRSCRKHSVVCAVC
jgi:hypothetical protein